MPTARFQAREVGIQPAICHLDPRATKINKCGFFPRLLEMEVIRDGSLEACDVVFCEWPRYEHFRLLRSERNLDFRLNQIPVASEQLQHKRTFARRLKRRPYMLRTYLESCRRRLRGLWVEKPFNTDRGEGISFLRDPHRWMREDHLLQRYLEDPWLVRGRKSEIRVIARINDDGSVRVYREGLVRVALRPFTLEDLDPLIHNSNPSFQWREGVESVEQHLLSDLKPDANLVDAMVGIVHDTVSMLRRRQRFGGSGDFEVMGYDFVVDRGGRPFLLEVNRFPGVWFDTAESKRFYLGMLRAIYRDL